MTALDDGEAAAHREVVRAIAAPGGPLAADSPHATVNDPRWFRQRSDGTSEPRASRALLHDRLVREHRDRFRAASNERLAVVLAGPPGAGKSTVLERVLGAAKSAYMHVDADDFKVALLEEARRDGTLDSLKPASTTPRCGRRGRRDDP